MKKVFFDLPPIYYFASRREWERACWKKIVGTETLFDVLVASYERHNFVMRAAVIDRVRTGMSYRQIAKELWLSLQTIRSIKKAMGAGTYRSYRERGKTERKKKVYSRDSAGRKQKMRGRHMRTKYGVVTLPS